MRNANPKLEALHAPTSFRSTLVALFGAIGLLSACSSSDPAADTAASASAGAGGSGSGGAAATTTSTSGNAATGASAGGATASTTTTTGSGGSGGAGAGVGAGLTKVGTGEYETFYLVDGTIYGYAWSTGLLGLGPNAPQIAIPPVPLAMPANLKFIDVQGGLHQSIALDENHHVWTWGDNGAAGDGGSAIGVKATPVMLTQDADGKDFSDIIAIYATSNADEGEYDAVVKSDGSVWIWGDLSSGIAGDGTEGQKAVTRPTRVPLPAGVKITELGVAASMAALGSDGTVWGWGWKNADAGTGLMGADDYKTPHKVAGLPANITHVAVGSGHYALTSNGELFGWGYSSRYVGIADNMPRYSAVSLKNILNLPGPVKLISTNSLSSHAILTDGSLWGWGDAACGGVGNGEEPDWNATTCNWDFNAGDDMIYAPKRIVPSKSNFKAVFANSGYDFYVYALTEDGHLYSWGRNKTGTLGNGVYPLAADGMEGPSSDMAGLYANSWDVPTATEVSPMTLVAGTGVNSPCCVKDPNAMSCSQ